jgi:hypothetical protein
MNYEALEIEIANRLNAKFVQLGLAVSMEAIVVPETEGELTQAFVKSRATVGYLGSTWKFPASTTTITQEETVTVRVVMETRKLRGVAGLYNFGEIIKNTITGYKPQGAERLFPVKYDMQDSEQNSFMPYIDFECRSVTVQAIPEDDPIIGAGLGVVSMQRIGNQGQHDQDTVNLKE